MLKSVSSVAVPSVPIVVRVGASLTAVTWIVTVASFESLVPSLALYLNVSSPLKFPFGV